jgi:Tol biopolymer transport system component
MKLLLLALAVAAFALQDARNPAPIRNGSLPSVSPDGSHIAFISNRTGNNDLFVITAGGTHEVQLTNTPETEGIAGWTSDSKHIVFSIFNNESSKLYQIDVDGKNQRELGVVAGRSAALSPDGKRIIYATGSWTEMGLFVTSLDGSSPPRQINDGKSIAWMTRWSPDGKQIAFTGRNDPKSELAIFVVNADGSGRRQLTRLPVEEGGAQGASWSPDGRRIAIQVVSRTRKGVAHIWIVDVASGEGRKLAAHDQVYLDETPSWFPDGKRLAFQSDRTGRMEVWVMNADGTDAKQITGLASTAATDPALVRYQKLITPDGLASRLYFFASDFFEGRDTTTRGQKLAAHYLASEYRQLGLAPHGTEKTNDPLTSFFQPFMVYRRNPRQARLEVTIDGKQVASSVFSAEGHDDLSFFYLGALTGATGGKWLLVLEDETQFINKRSALLKSKPQGVLVVANTGSPTFEERAAQTSRNLQRLGGLSLVESSDFPPTFVISNKFANQLLAPSNKTVDDLRKSPTIFELDPNVKITASFERSPSLRTENVLAFIEGTDPKLKNEVLVVSSHYDHLGVNPALKGDQIYNGAADDGSGVVASLELAQWFMKAKRDGFGPRRSILFVNFTGEERGLLGSNYYSRQPVVPWEKTVAAINMDGVGGIDLDHPAQSKNYIYILGTQELSSELMDVTTGLNRTLGTNLDLTPNQGFNSDHYNFQVQFIPYIYYSTGLTEKYHQPGDEPNTIDYNHFARVVQLIFATAWQVANQNARIRSIDRSQLSLVGYSCPPCPYSCDDHVYSQPGECPVCGMALVPKYKR